MPCKLCSYSKPRIYPILPNPKKYVLRPWDWGGVGLQWYCGWGAWGTGGLDPLQSPSFNKSIRVRAAQGFESADFFLAGASVLMAQQDQLQYQQ
eukprot:3017617-Amphidinium_carterae.1